RGERKKQLSILVGLHLSSVLFRFQRMAAGASRRTCEHGWLRRGGECGLCRDIRAASAACWKCCGRAGMNGIDIRWLRWTYTADQPSFGPRRCVGCSAELANLTY